MQFGLSPGASNSVGTPFHFFFRLSISRASLCNVALPGLSSRCRRKGKHYNSHFIKSLAFLIRVPDRTCQKGEQQGDEPTPRRFRTPRPHHMPLFVYGAPEACQAKCEKANTPKEAEACLTKERPKP